MRPERASQRGQITIQDEGVDGGGGLVRNRALTPLTVLPEKDLPSSTNAIGHWHEWLRAQPFRR